MGYISSHKVRHVASPGSGLLDSRFDHDSCGVGFVATLRNEPSQSILSQALTALARLAHRGAIAADGKSSDGVGIMTGIPRKFLLDSVGCSLEAEKPLAVAVVFLPTDTAAAKQALKESLASQQLEILAWRVVPTRPEVLGEIALEECPRSRAGADHLLRSGKIGSSALCCPQTVRAHAPREFRRGIRLLDILLVHGLQGAVRRAFAG